MCPKKLGCKIRKSQPGILLLAVDFIIVTVCSRLIQEPGLVKLRGDVHDNYGSAVESAFSLLDRILTDMRLEQQLKHSIDSNTLVQESSV